MPKALAGEGGTFDILMPDGNGWQSLEGVVVSGGRARSCGDREAPGRRWRLRYRLRVSV
jgi:hypothetical protein